jgi:hypothetical protein
MYKGLKKNTLLNFSRIYLRCKNKICLHKFMNSVIGETHSSEFRANRASNSEQRTHTPSVSLDGVDAHNYKYNFQLVHMHAPWNTGIQINQIASFI